MHENEADYDHYAQRSISHKKLVQIHRRQIVPHLVGPVTPCNGARAGSQGTPLVLTPTLDLAVGQYRTAMSLTQPYVPHLQSIPQVHRRRRVLIRCRSNPQSPLTILSPALETLIAQNRTSMLMTER